MSLTRKMKVKLSDGSFKEVDLGCLAVNVLLDNGKDLETEVQDIYAAIEEGGGGTGLVPGNVSNLSIVERNEKLIIKWKDPDDLILEGVTLCAWGGTKLVMKVGSYPEKVTDGTLLIDSKVKNQYQTNGYTINNLDNDTTYYFSLFPYSVDGAVNTKTDNRISGTPVAFPPADVSNLKVKVGNTKLTLSWADPPQEIKIGDEVVGTWEGTKVLYKIGSYPASVSDGILLVDNKVHNQYSSNGIELNNLTNGTEYYFRLFPYNTDGAYNTNKTNNEVSGTPQPFKVMTAIIDESNSNPATCITYADDAVDMVAGSSDWDDFFGIRPCLMQNGVVTKYLNPNDFTKDVDGNTVSLTTVGTDVMIEFPRRGLKISKSGNQITVKMTDKADDADFDYYAHKRGNTQKDYFYLGAYLAFNQSSKLYSIKGKTPTASVSLSDFITYANARGAGYEIMAAFQVYFVQAMYILKYKNLNSQSTVGKGFVSGLSAITTGGSETFGMSMELATSTQKTNGTTHVKLFGLEDFWGNLYQYLSGIASNSSRNLLLTTNNFKNLTTSGGQEYTYTTGVTSNTGGYMNKSQGTSLGGFTMANGGASGSATTYYADYAHLNAGRFACFSGSYSNGDAAGAFYFRVSSNGSADSYVGCRLMYL